MIKAYQLLARRRLSNPETVDVDRVAQSFRASIVRNGSCATKTARCVKQNGRRGSRARCSARAPDGVRRTCCTPSPRSASQPGSAASGLSRTGSPFIAGGRPPAQESKMTRGKSRPSNPFPAKYVGEGFFLRAILGPTHVVSTTMCRIKVGRPFKPTSGRRPDLPTTRAPALFVVQHSIW